MKRFDLECSHDNDNDFLVTESPTGTYAYAADVEAVEAEARESAFLEAIEIVMQSKDVESVLTLLRSKAGGPKLKVAPRSKP